MKPKKHKHKWGKWKAPETRYVMEAFNVQKRCECGAVQKMYEPMILIRLNLLKKDLNRRPPKYVRVGEIIPLGPAGIDVVLDDRSKVGPLYQRIRKRRKP